MVSGKLRGKQNHANILSAKCLSGKISDQGRIQAARKPNDGILETHLLEIVAQTKHQCVMNQRSLFRNGQTVFGGTVITQTIRFNHLDGLLKEGQSRVNIAVAGISH